jgi:hypothetical protein
MIVRWTIARDGKQREEQRREAKEGRELIISG